MNRAPSLLIFCLILSVTALGLGANSTPDKEKRAAAEKQCKETYKEAEKASKPLPSRARKEAITLAKGIMDECLREAKVNNP
jgi:hypothetical protein